MNKIITKGLAAAAIIAGMTSCSHQMETWTEAQIDQASYEYAFVKRFGEPSPTQTWGFGDETTRALTRSFETPTVKFASAPYDEEWVTNYLATAKEPDSTNATDNADNGYQAQCRWYANGGGKLSTLLSNYDWCVYEGSPVTQADKDWYTANVKALIDPYLAKWNWNDYPEAAYNILMKLKEYTGDYNYWNLNVNSEGGWVEDPTFVRNFKITGEWTGPIDVVGKPWLTNGVENGYARTVVVTGKWNLTNNQIVGALGRIIVASGGEIVVGDGATLSSVNEAQIVVLPGGKISGKGSIVFTNGTDQNLISYNGGEINVGTFNNNGGDFYNFGTLKATSLLGGAGNSRYYNHSLISIKNTGEYDSSSSNTRVYNACQFYCSGNMRIRNYEGIQGSSLICDGQLMLSCSMDGTSTKDYVGLAAGALVQCGTLYNNNTIWRGPASDGYAVLDVRDSIVFINNNIGDFSQNLYICAGTWGNKLSGGNYAKSTPLEAFLGIKEEYYSRPGIIDDNAVKIIEKSDATKDELISTDEGFVKGEKGCTPGFKGKTPDPEPDPDPDPDPTPNIRVIAEDLTVDEKGDFDFNDVVFDVILNYPEGKTTIILQAAGGTLPLTVGGQEVHHEFGVDTNVMVNTKNNSVERNPAKFVLDIQYSNANDIPVRVQKNGSWLDLEAKRGRVPSKIGVKPTYNWCDERVDIEKQYPDFGKWVQNENIEWY